MEEVEKLEDVKAAKKREEEELQEMNKVDTSIR